MIRKSAILLFVALSGCQPKPEEASVAPPAEATPANSAPAAARAVTGEAVLMFLTHVKGDHRDSFEKFMAFFKETLDQIAASDAEFARKTGTFRMLGPREPNEDGTLTYALLADPMHEGTDTRLDTVLARLYPEEKIAELRKPWDDAMARPQDGFDFAQAEFPNRESTGQAANGEPVVMFFTYIRAEKKAELDELLAFFDKALKTIGDKDPDFARKSATFRALHSSEPMEDGSLLYVFMGDPILEGAETQLVPILSRLYSEKEIEEYVKPWEEAVIRQQTYNFVQTEF